MSARYPRAAVAATILLLLAGCNLAPSDAEIEHAITVRTELGLSTDRAHVIRVIGDPTADLTYGAPLLPAEAADAEARGWARGQVGALIWYGVRHPDQYAGTWSDDGTTVLAFTGDIDRHREALRAIAPGAAIRVQQVEFTEAELWVIMDRLRADADLLAEQGIVLNGHGLMQMTNRVELDARAPDPAAAERWLEDRYGPGLAATVIELRLRLAHTDREPLECSWGERRAHGVRSRPIRGWAAPRATLPGRGAPDGAHARESAGPTGTGRA